MGGGFTERRWGIVFAWITLRRIDPGAQALTCATALTGTPVLFFVCRWRFWRLCKAICYSLLQPFSLVFFFVALRMFRSFFVLSFLYVRNAPNAWHAVRERCWRMYAHKFPRSTNISAVDARVASVKKRFGPKQHIHKRRSPGGVFFMWQSHRSFVTCFVYRICGSLCKSYFRYDAVTTTDQYRNYGFPST